MKIKILGLFLICILIPFLSFDKVAAETATSHLVSMKSISFEPRSLEIHVGDSVVWQNVSYTDHSAKAEDDSFDTGFVHVKQKSKAIKFLKPGTFTYHCATHGKTMSGTITVTP